MKSPFLTLPARLRSRGFSLFEVIVAISLLSIAVAAIIQVYSINLNSTRKADLYTRAIIHARSVMDETLSSEELDEASGSEDIDDQFEIIKSITILPVEDDDLVETYEITVNISWHGGSIELKSQKSILKSSDE
ncbi:MAG: type II secretion system protein [Thermodesulfovibrionales bacterium]